MIQELTDNKYSISLLENRFAKMVAQNFECAVVIGGVKLIGVCGLWFCSKHYSGKSVELGHVIIKENYRNEGLGHQFMDWIERYVE